jgi:hypothetical protein
LKLRWWFLLLSLIENSQRTFLSTKITNKVSLHSAC